MKLFFVISVLIAGILLPARVMAAPPQLKINKNQIVEASGGCTIRLKGVDISALEYSNNDGPASGGITASVAYAINTWKANVIRLPLNQDRWNTYDYSYRTLVDSIVNLCSQNNAYVILDLHWSGEGQPGQATKQYSMPDSNSTAFWSSVATRYANNPAVLYDLFNEPFVGSGGTWLNGGTANEGFSTPGFKSLLARFAAWAPITSSSWGLPPLPDLQRDFEFRRRLDGYRKRQWDSLRRPIFMTTITASAPVPEPNARLRRHLRHYGG